jgi:hypothetical protein
MQRPEGCGSPPSDAVVAGGALGDAIDLIGKVSELVHHELGRAASMYGPSCGCKSAVVPPSIGTESS